jgi:hypothetical protein
MKRHSRSFPYLSKALDRLEASDTAVKRKNALAAFSRAVKDLQAQVARQYPKLRSDGTAIVRRKARGARCPLCKVPVRSFAVLVTHMHNSHTPHMPNDWSCPCGKQFPGRNGRARLARHLACVGDLQQHLLPYVLQEFAKEFG